MEEVSNLNWLRKKYKTKGIKLTSVYFNSTTKPVIINLIMIKFDHKFDLDKSFQEILYRSITGLMKDLAGLITGLMSLNTITF